MNTWIKALGMSAIGGRIPDHWEDEAEGLFNNAITFGGRPGMAPGDRVVLYASGWGSIFAVGEVTSFPYKAEADAVTRWPWRVNVTLTAKREYVHLGTPIHALNVDGRNMGRVIMRRSHVRLSDAEYDAAEQALTV